MASIGIILILLSLVITPVLAIASIVRGYKGMKISGLLETADKKVKTGFWLASAIHMWAGILITLCYAVACVLIMAQN